MQKNLLEMTNYVVMGMKWVGKDLVTERSP